MQANVSNRSIFSWLAVAFLCPAFVYCVRVADPTKLLQKLKSGTYNRYVTPTQNDGRPTEIEIGFYIEGMSSIRPETMDFFVDIYFEQRWSDRRIAHNDTKRILIKDLSIFELMWHPDLYFANANNAKYFEVTAPNFLIWVFPNGTVHWESRISLSVMCNMDLGFYPLDTQECDIRILSYAYTEDLLRIHWKKVKAITSNAQLKLPDMEIVEIKATDCDGEYQYGMWSCLRGVFRMRRQIMHHILQSYVPTVLIVVISWFSFWLDIDSVPGRVSLCITTLLTLATQASSTRLSLPQVSYAKAIDVWMEACLGFVEWFTLHQFLVFGVLIEFTIVNYLARRDSDDETIATEPQRYDSIGDSIIKRKEGEMLAAWTAALLLNNVLDYRNKQKRKMRDIAIGIDKCCRFAFPGSFFIFNFAYWTYYMLSPK